MGAGLVDEAKTAGRFAVRVLRRKKAGAVSADGEDIVRQPGFRIDWCSFHDAKLAVEYWHYSHNLPQSKLARLGVWESNRFVGAIVFGVGATAGLVQQYGLLPQEGAKLIRIALDKHITPVSQMMSVALRLLKREMMGLRLIVSFADPEHHHLGGIYQAGNWIYTGLTQSSDEYLLNGRRLHGRTLRHQKPSHLTTHQAAFLLDPHYSVVKGSRKHRYLYPLDDAMRRQLSVFALPYPKRATSIVADATGDQPVEGGSTPTVALHTLFDLNDYIIPATVDDQSRLDERCVTELALAAQPQRMEGI